MDARSCLGLLLGGSCAYLPLVSWESKLPAVRFRRGSTGLLAAPPEAGAYGVVPEGRLVVVDFDVDKSLTGKDRRQVLRRQVRDFEALLQVRLRDTLLVRTPSGGLHAYFMLPSGRRTWLPCTRLDQMNEAASRLLGRKVELRGDVRSGARRGYVVGPDRLSRSDRAAGSYALINVREPLILPAVSMQAARKVSSLVRQAAGSRRKQAAQDRAAAFRQMREDGTFRVYAAAGGSTSLPALGERQGSVPHSVLARVGKALEVCCPGRKFHEKRAFVKSALHCCFNDAAIARACVDLGVDRDTARNGALRPKELRYDVEKFQPAGRFHGPYCGHGRPRTAPPAVSNGRSLEENLEALRQRAVSGRIARYQGAARRPDPRVIDPLRVWRNLGRVCSPSSQQFRDAAAVFDFFLQPLCNSGARRVLLTMSALQGRLGLTPSRAKQALRVLRKAGVIVVTRRQRTGLAPLYTVPAGLTQKTMTRALRNAWVVSSSVPQLRQPVFFDRATGEVREVFTGKVAQHFVNAGRFLNRLRKASLGRSAGLKGPGAALAYLVEEKAAHGLAATPEGDLVLLSTGEVVEQAPSLSWRDLRQGRNLPAAAALLRQAAPGARTWSQLWRRATSRLLNRPASQVRRVPDEVVSALRREVEALDGTSAPPGPQDAPGGLRPGAPAGRRTHPEVHQAASSATIPPWRLAPGRTAQEGVTSGSEQDPAGSCVGAGGWCRQRAGEYQPSGGVPRRVPVDGPV